MYCYARCFDKISYKFRHFANRINSNRTRYAITIAICTVTKIISLLNSKSCMDIFVNSSRLQQERSMEYVDHKDDLKEVFGIAFEIFLYTMAKQHVRKNLSKHEQTIKAGFDRNSLYQDSSKEKNIRGYRYELYCGSKANHSTQCTLLTQINYEEAWKLNENRSVDSDKYDRSVFDALLMRYEEPDGKNRWDSPLFVTFPDRVLEFEEISKALLGKKAPPPNMSTQNAPLSSTNFLYDLNRVVKDVTDKLIKHIKDGDRGQIHIAGYRDLSIDVTNITIQKLVILSRQYLTYSKMHAPDINQVPQLYIQYLRANLN
ncbi:Chromatin associated protein KTI12 [Popillia japonica]|uniref:Protein KTI12 homolog n=1 Tax=Popillia japonica TaxID=7064 RepID=A0AAW1IWH1_POPJA